MECNYYQTSIFPKEIWSDHILLKDELDAKSFGRIGLTNKFFNSLTKEIDIGYWNLRFFIEFKSYEKEVLFRVNVIWKNAFYCCSIKQNKIKTSRNEIECIIKKHIKKTDDKPLSITLYSDVAQKLADHAELVLKSKDSSIDLTYLYGLFSNIENELSLPDSHAKAQYYLAFCYFNKLGVNQNLEKALKYLKLSADQDNDEAQLSLGIYKGVNQDFHEAFKYIKLSADQGNAQAQLNVGFCFNNGQGTDKDLKEAFKYYKLSADQGNAGAQHHLGLFYETGLGTDINFNEAFKYHKLSADQGNVNAQFCLGVCFYNGGGTEKDLDEAFKYFKLSADQANAKALDVLNELKKTNL